MLVEPNYVEVVSDKLRIKISYVEAVLKLVEEQNTVPFIARYRKEVTGNLDENVIRDIIECREKEENLYKAKKTAINGIQEQDKLTEEIENSIINAQTLKEVEDIYAPFRRKKKTKAQIAIEKGFDVIALQIKNQEDIVISGELLEKYSKEEIMEGAQDIVIQEFVDDVKLRASLRFYYTKYGEVDSKYKIKIGDLPDKILKQQHKFEIYNDFIGGVVTLKAYQILAINRGENLGFLNVKLVRDEISYKNFEEQLILKRINVDILRYCVQEAYKKLFKSIETEVRNLLTERAEIESIRTFQENLLKLLMTKPDYDKTLIAIDPGYRTGCKIVVIDKNSNPVEFSKIYLHQEDNAKKIVLSLISKYKPVLIVVGNGTASNETIDFLKNNYEIEIVVVNESGASVYSASDVGAEEFPNLDVTDRGTVSIGRRYIDPLAELVKVPVHNIGVGMYQHDINQKELEKKLNYVVEDVVNLVGVNVNSASVYVLKYISGLTQKNAQKIVDNKPYKSRAKVGKILTKKAYEQAAGFLRVPNSKEEFDNTNIHPSQYKLARFIIDKKISVNDYESYKSKLKELYDLVAPETIKDILDAYSNIGKDPRIYCGHLKIEKTKNVEDLKVGDVVKGIVRNVMQFGAFVDIGVKNNGLVHISQLANKFVKDPLDIVQIGQEVMVKIMEIDLEKGKIGLSMKEV